MMPRAWRRLLFFFFFHFGAVLIVAAAHTYMSLVLKVSLREPCFLVSHQTRVICGFPLRCSFFCVCAES